MKLIILTLTVAWLGLVAVQALGAKKYNNIMEITKEWDGKKPKRARDPNVKAEYVVGMEVNPADAIDFRARLDQEKGSAAKSGTAPK